jgi:hypothetical protein
LSVASGKVCENIETHSSLSLSLYIYVYIYVCSMLCENVR